MIGFRKRKEVECLKASMRLFGSFQLHLCRQIGIKLFYQAPILYKTISHSYSLIHHHNSNMTNNYNLIYYSIFLILPTPPTHSFTHPSINPQPLTNIAKYRSSIIHNSSIVMHRQPPPEPQPLLLLWLVSVRSPPVVQELPEIVAHLPGADKARDEAHKKDESCHLQGVRL